MRKQLPFFVLLFLVFLSVNTFAQYNWAKLSGASIPYNVGKQDDIYFINKDTGWAVNGPQVVNGFGHIYRTNDGGTTWTTQLTQQGTYFRCLGFVDDSIGFAGNIGTDYFQNVTDTVPLYKTTDGGTTWSPVSYTGPTVKGICAINIVKTAYNNAGHLDYKVTIYAAGRVGSPTFLMKSTDKGQTWTSKDMSSYCSMITDVYFVNKDTGFVFGGTNGDFAYSSSTIIYTTDGGQTFSTVYTSSRTFEMNWKGCFPSRKVGYATVLSLDPDPSNINRYVVKTIDGGLTWTELPLTNTGKEEFGIGFINDTVGWVGTSGTGYQTLDGGATWTNKTIGGYANKIRFVKINGGFIAYAIGLNVYKLTSLASDVNDIRVADKSINVYPNPSANTELFVEFENTDFNKIKIEVMDMQGKKWAQQISKVDQKTAKISLAGLSNGVYILQLTEDGKIFTEKFIVGTVKP